jgi:protein TonB
MRLGSRTVVTAFSVAAHATLGAVVGTIPPSVRHEVVAISVTETRKAPPPAPPRLPDVPPPPTAAPARVKAAPLAKPTPVPPLNAPPAPAMEALPDFGLSLGGTTGGLAVPAGGQAAAPPPAVEAKTLSRAATPPKDACSDPPAKPKLLSRPTPIYTAEARAAGVSGKVRVEIVVDEHGRVVSVRLLEGLGHGLDESALAAARQMTFDAAVRCGRPTSATFKIGFTFSPSAT